MRQYCCKEGYIKESDKGHSQTAPEILVIAPAPIVRIIDLFPQFDDVSIEKSRELPALYKQLAKEENCNFLDASLHVT